MELGYAISSGEHAPLDLVGYAVRAEEAGFGFAFALCLFLAGLFTCLTARRDPDVYASAGMLPMLYFIAAGLRFQDRATTPSRAR